MISRSWEENQWVEMVESDIAEYLSSQRAKLNEAQVRASKDDIQHVGDEYRVGVPNSASASCAGRLARFEKAHYKPQAAKEDCVSVRRDQLEGGQRLACVQAGG